MAVGSAAKAGTRAIQPVAAGTSSVGVRDRAGTSELTRLSNDVVADSQAVYFSPKGLAGDFHPFRVNSQ